MSLVEDPREDVAAVIFRALETASVSPSGRDDA
jgi:hypothetical protein